MRNPAKSRRLTKSPRLTQKSRQGRGRGRLRKGMRNPPRSAVLFMLVNHLFTSLDINLLLSFALLLPRFAAQLKGQLHHKGGQSRRQKASNQPASLTGHSSPGPHQVRQTCPQVMSRLDAGHSGDSSPGPHQVRQTCQADVSPGPHQVRQMSSSDIQILSASDSEAF